MTDKSGFVAVIFASRLSTKWASPVRIASACSLSVSAAAAISVNLARGRREIDCGCFAASARVPLSNWLVVRNAVLIGAACLLLMPVRARTLVWIDGLTVVTTLITLSLLWAAGQRLAQTGPALRQLGGAR